MTPAQVRYHILPLYSSNYKRWSVGNTTHCHWVWHARLTRHHQARVKGIYIGNKVVAGRNKRELCPPCVGVMDFALQSIAIYKRQMEKNIVSGKTC